MICPIRSIAPRRLATLYSSRLLLYSHEAPEGEDDDELLQPPKQKTVGAYMLLGVDELIITNENLGYWEQ